MATARTRRMELFAGLFLNLIIALIMISLLLLGGIRGFFRERNHFQFYMGNAEGLLPGAQVMVNGVSVGRVSAITLEGPRGSVKVRVEIAKKFRNFIHTDSVVAVTPQGLLGDKVVLISPGSASAAIAPDDSMLTSRSGVSVSDLMAKGDALLATLNRVIGNLDRMVGQFNSTPESRNIARNVGELLQNLRELSEKVNRGVDENTLKKSLANLSSILEKIDHGQGTLAAIINDPTVYDDLKRLTGEANQNRIVRNLVRKTIEDSEANQAGQSAAR